MDARIGELDLVAQLDTGLERPDRDRHRRGRAAREGVRHRGLQRALAERTIARALQERRDQRQRVVDPSGEHGERRPHREQLLEQLGVLHLRFRDGQHTERVVLTTQPAEEVRGAFQRQHGAVPAVARRRLVRGEHLLGLDEASLLVQRRTQQVRRRQPDLAGQSVDLEHRAREPLAHRHVGAPEGLSSGVDQHLRVRWPSGVQSPRRQATGVVATTAPDLLERFGQAVEGGASVRLRHRRSGDLDVQGVLRPELAAPPVLDVVDEPCVEQLLGELPLARRLERVDPEGFAERDRIQQPPRRFTQRRQSLLDQLAQPRRWRHRTCQGPMAVGAGEDTRVAQPGDQLSQVEQVAAAGPHQRRGHHAVDPARKDLVEQRGHRVVVEWRHVHPGDQLVAPQQRDRLGHLLAGAEREQQVGTAGHGQVQQQRRRGVVEQVDVVDRDQQLFVIGEPVEQLGRRVLQLSSIALDTSAGGEHLGEGTQRHARGHPGGADLHQVRRRGRSDHLGGESGLAHPGGTGEQDPSGAAVRHGPVQLDLPPHQRPGDSHVATVPNGPTAGAAEGPSCARN